MIVLITVNFIAVLLAYLSSNKRYNHLFDLSFIILVLVYGIRCHYGNDYDSYEGFYDYVISFSSFVATLEDGHFENGWVILNYIFRPLGFRSLVFFLTIMQFLPIYLLIKKYSKPQCRYVALFVFLFSTETLINLSSMRQCLAISIILLSLLLYEKKNGWLFVLLSILLAVQFHTSAYIMLILPLIMLLSRAPRKMVFMSYVGILLVTFLFSNVITGAIEYILGFDALEQYQSIQSGENEFMTYGVGFILNVILCCIIVFFLYDQGFLMRFFALFYSFSYIFTSIAYSNGQVARMSMYFSPIFCLLVTPLLQSLKNHKPYLLLVLLLVLLLRLYAYCGFFFAPVWTKHYLQYTTIFNY